MGDKSLGVYKLLRGIIRKPGTQIRRGGREGEGRKEMGGKGREEMRQVEDRREKSEKKGGREGGEKREG